MATIIRRLAVLAVCLLVACSATREQDKQLDATLDLYAAAVRWGSVDDAIAFLAPDAAQPTRFERERLAQLQVAGYREQPPLQISPTEVEQVVQIDFVNRHTQESRSTIERMRWRYDATAQRWWLVSGLPKLSAQ